jgi:hypothetical protein
MNVKEGANEQAILHDTDGDEGDGGLESVMPWLQELHNLTRSCQFSKFWAEFNGSSEPAQRKFPLPPCFIVVVNLTSSIQRHVPTPTPPPNPHIPSLIRNFNRLMFP